MKMTGSSFEQIMQELLKQKQLLEDLETENDELHRQLADLRDGRGIFVEILGERYPLVSEPVSAPPATAPAAEPDLSLQETPAIISEASSSSLPETPLPVTEVPVEEVSEDQPTLASTDVTGFLEEALLDEFSTAPTIQMAASPGPITNPGVFDEKEKETLRRELSGSFLLE